MDESNELIQWFWQVLESFSNDERILFMRFVSGRSRLPANPADISQRFQIMKVDRVSATASAKLSPYMHVHVLRCVHVHEHVYRVYVLCTPIHFYRALNCSAQSP